MIQQGKSVFRGLICTRNEDELKTSTYKDLCKTLGINYLDLEIIIDKIKERQLELQMKEQFEE